MKRDVDLTGFGSVRRRPHGVARGTGRKGQTIESSTHHLGRVRAAAESHVGANRCARPKGELASGSDGPRLP